MPAQGPLFTDIQPINPAGVGVAYGGGALVVPNLAGLDVVAARQIVLETFGVFRIGQTIFFEIEIQLEEPGITAILLQTWWLKPQQEFRAVGPFVIPPFYWTGPTGVDENAFGPPGASLATTERLWQSDQIRYGQVEPAFPAVPVGKTYTTMVDNVWRLPVDPALVGPGYTKTKAFHWPAHGYALAFTSAFEGQLPQGGFPTLRISWMTGATHSIVQDDVE